MEAIGDRQSGAGSLKRKMSKSMRFFSVHAGYVEGTASLIIAQSALWAGLLREAGTAIDVWRFGTDPKARYGRVCTRKIFDTWAKRAVREYWVSTL